MVEQKQKGEVQQKVGRAKCGWVECYVSRNDFWCYPRI